jgi:hypothetical protein
MSSLALPDLDLVVIAAAATIAIALVAIVARRSLAIVAAAIVLAWQAVAVVAVALRAHLGESVPAPGDLEVAALALALSGHLLGVLVLMAAWNLRRRTGSAEVDPPEAAPAGEEDS